MENINFNPNGIELARSSASEIDSSILKTNSYVTPEMFGAKGDGITDDDIAINLALESKKIVMFGNKTYIVSSPILLKDNNYIIFCNTTLKTNTNTTVLQVGTTISNISTIGGSITGVLKIIGSGNKLFNDCAILICNHSYININANINISGFGGTQIKITSNGRGTQYNYIGGAIECVYNYGSGIVIDFDENVSGSYVKDNTFNNIRIHENIDSNGKKIVDLKLGDGNRFHNCGFESIKANDVLLTLDKVTNNTFESIRLDGLSNGKALSISVNAIGNSFHCNIEGIIEDFGGLNTFKFVESGLIGNRYGAGNKTTQSFDIKLSKPGSINELHITPNVSGGVIRFPSIGNYYFGDRDGGDNAPINLDATNKRIVLSTLPSTPIGSGPKIRFDGRFSSTGNYNLCSIYQSAYGITCELPSGVGLHTTTFFSLNESIVNPTATPGKTNIYIDSATGNLNVQFGNGTIKTIATKL